DWMFAIPSATISAITLVFIFLLSFVFAIRFSADQLALLTCPFNARLARQGESVKIIAFMTLYWNKRYLRTENDKQGKGLRLSEREVWNLRVPGRRGYRDGRDRSTFPNALRDTLRNMGHPSSKAYLWRWILLWERVCWKISARGRSVWRLCEHYRFSCYVLLAHGSP